MMGPLDCSHRQPVQGIFFPKSMAVFHLKFVRLREGVSGIALAVAQIVARTDAEIIGEADCRFTRLLGTRSGSAILRDDAGRVVWTLRRSAEVSMPPTGECGPRMRPPGNPLSSLATPGEFPHRHAPDLSPL